MLLKLANRAFVRAVTHRPLTMSSRLSKLSKIDADMVNYVEQQLGEEKERTLPAIKGWSSVEIQGALGVMNKDGENGEKVTVRFNTNGTLPQKEEQDALEEAGREVLCYPDFEVIIEKSGKKCMFFNCTVETDHDAGEDVDPFEIHSVSMANKDEEEPYVLNMDVMEDDFYDGMYSFIEDRGINDEFCEELVSICTDLEANNYRQLLIDMKSFVQ